MTIIKQYNTDTSQWEAIAVGQKGDTGEGVAAGGTTDQILTKASNTDFDTQWVSTIDANVLYDNTNSTLSATLLQTAIDELDQKKLNISALSASVKFFPTTAAGAVAGYGRLVTNSGDADYDNPAVSVTVGPFSGTDQLLGSLVSDAGVLEGNTTSINVTTIGNVRRTSGNLFDRAEFYFEVYKRDSGGTETLIGTSSNTSAVSQTDFQEFFADALITDTNFTATDRVVLKFYGSVLSGGGGETYQFQYGGNQPVRTLFPVPVTVVPSEKIAVDIQVDASGFSGLLSGTDDDVQTALDTLDGVTKSDIGLGNVDNVSAADLRDRSTHTGTQTLSTISDAGTIASQDANSVNIDGGNIDGTAIGVSATSSGSFTTIDGSGDMNIDSGTLFVDASENRVGIGTTSPNTQLDVYGTNDTPSSNSTFWNFTFSGCEINNSSNTSNTVSGIVFTGGSARNSLSAIGNILESTELGALAFYAGGKGRSSTVPERMRIDSSGNVGIGTTSPSQRLEISESVDGGAAAIRITNTFAAFGSTDETSDLEFWSGTNGAPFRIAKISSYKGGDYFSANTELNGGLTFWTQASVASPSTTGFAERMRIDSSGRVGIGTTSPSASLDISDGNVALIVGADASAKTRTTNTVKSYRIGSVHYNTSEEPFALLVGASTSTTNGIDIGGGTGLLNSATQITFLTSPNTTTTGGTERMRITSTGNIGIGQSSPRSKLNIDAGNVSGIQELINLHNKSRNNNTGTSLTFSGYDDVTDFPTWRYAGIRGIYDTTSSGLNSGGWGGQLRFFVNRGGGATQFEDVITITGGGNVGIGTTSPNGKLVIRGGNGDHLTLDNAGERFTQTNFNNNGTTKTYLFWDNTVSRFTIQPGASGGVYLAENGTSWTSASDERKKDIIEPIADASNKVMSLRAVIGKYKTDENNKRRSFLLAQDVQNVLPEAVDAKDPENLGIQYTDVIPLLVAAIQELKAELDELKGTQ